MRGAEHTIEKRAFMVRDAHHTSQAAAAVANSVHKNTVQYNVCKLRAHGVLKTRPRSGRPKKGTGFALYKIEALARANRRLKLERLLVLVKEKGIDLSINTLRARLDEIDYRRYKACKKPLLDEDGKKQRLEYAEEHRTTNAHHLMFSDEAKVANGYNRQIWVTRQPHEAFLDECLGPRFKIHTGVMVWAAVWHGGRTPLIKLDMSKSLGKKKGFTAKLYIDQVLKPILGPAWRRFRRGKKDPYIIEDNSKVHNSAECDAAKRGMRIALHPPNSPDLNVIEHVWAELKRRMNLIPRLPSNKDKLFEIAERVWEEIPQEFIDKCVDSFQQRLQDVIANKGGHTRW
jgi:hypothetical protein